MDNTRTIDKINAAIAYFEDAIKESDEIIADCSPALQQSLTEQKEHFETALAVLRAAAKFAQLESELVRH